MCWQCGNTFPPDHDHCPEDGSQLVELDPAEEGDPLIGRVFDYRFRILGKLGEGGMSVIYSARRTEGDGQVALKVLKADFLRDPEVRKRFMYEARVISNLEHSNAVDLFDFGQAPDGSFYMVMELLRGGSLADRLDGGALTYREIFHFLPPVCGVLAEAHGKDVIHRDLKPENIYLADMGEDLPVPKLLDFGIAKHLASRTMTKNDQLWGTPAYMSPEQAAGDTVAGTADIYAMGVMLYELIAGVLPFRASTAMGFATKHMHREPTPLSDLPGMRDVPERLESLVLEMLSKEPDDRPPDMGEVVRELRKIEHDVFDERMLSAKPSLQLDRSQLTAPDAGDEAPGEGGSGNIEIDPSIRDAQTALVDSAEAGADGSEAESGDYRATQMVSSTDEVEAVASESQPTDIISEIEGTNPWFRRPVGLIGMAAGLVGLVAGSYVMLGSGWFGATDEAGGEDRTPRRTTAVPADEKEKADESAAPSDDAPEATTATKAAGVAAAIEQRARRMSEGTDTPEADAGGTGSGEAPESTESVGSAAKPDPQPEKQPVNSLSNTGSESDEGGWARPDEEGESFQESTSDQEESGSEDENIDEALESTF